MSIKLPIANEDRTTLVAELRKLGHVEINQKGTAGTVKHNGETLFTFFAPIDRDQVTITPTKLPDGMTEDHLKDILLSQMKQLTGR